jgi:hypothetical protein
MERVRKFRQQRSNAKRRGIGWELTFKQWREIWNDSDLYHLRDRRGFVMHRNSDESPYAVGNVEIISPTDNFREAMEIHYMGDRNYSHPLWTLL